MDQWLIRTAENWIAGPYPKEQVRKMVLEGKLGLQDEVCPANSYWLYLHEHAEIQKALGVQIPKSANGDDVTETQIPQGVVEEKRKGPPAPPTGSSTGSGAEGTTTGTVIRKSIFEPLLEKAQSEAARNAALEAGQEEGDGATRVSSLYQTQQPGALSSSQNVQQSHVAGSADQRPSMWKGLIWMMVLAGLVLVGVVVRLILNR